MPFSEPFRLHTGNIPELENGDFTIEVWHDGVVEVAQNYVTPFCDGMEPDSDGWYHFTVTRGPARKTFWQRLLSLLPWRR
jgi:hypothetical protein